MRRLSAALPLLLALGAVAQAAPPVATSATAAPAPSALLQFQHDLVSILALRDDATHLTAAAILARSTPNLPRVLSFERLLARAEAATGASAEVSWVALADCDHARATACPAPAALQRLQRQAPQNAAVWILALDVAARAGDSAAERAALARAAAATEYSTYYGHLLRATLIGASALPMPVAVVRELAGANGNANAAGFAIAAGNVMFLPAPSLAPAFTLCRKADHDAALRADCLKLAHLLAWGDTVIARNAGLALHERLAASAADKAHYASERRNVAWQTQQYAQLMLRARSEPAIAAKAVTLGADGGTENSIMLGLLRAESIPLQPPLDWTPQPLQAHE
ncbi:MAG TPA: hypothetical protein VND63_00520 [Rhodanobacteraceae bacterium]|nr:hypothetical protein [Rhodanobacteraceae bacterium]